MDRQTYLDEFYDEVIVEDILQDDKRSCLIFVGLDEQLRRLF